MQSNLRSILVRTTSCQVHPATCTHLWKAFFGIAWVLYQLGSLHNARKSTSAMSNFEKKKPKNFYYHPQKQSLKTTKNPNQSLNPINQFIHTTSKKNHCKCLAEFAEKSNRYLNKKNLILIHCPHQPFYITYLLLHKSVLQECFYDCYKDLDHLQLGNYFYHESLVNKFAKF